MAVDPVSDSASLRQPETKKGSKTPDRTGSKKEFENEDVLNKVLGDEKKRDFLKKSAPKETAAQKSEISKSLSLQGQKGKYIDEMV